MVNGRVVNYKIPADLLKPGTCDPELIIRRRLSYKKAYQKLQEAITAELALMDPTWAIAASAQLKEEQTQLEQYFKDMPDSEQRSLRIAELMNRSPRVQVRPLRAALLYLPKLEYRIMQVDKEEKINRITYDPVSSQYDFT